MIGITLLGSTGSIGVSTLDVVARHPERFRIVALTANRDAEGLAAQCRRHRPEYAVMADPAAAGELKRRLAGMAQPPEVLAGTDALASVAALPQVDYVMAAIVGAAGLLPTLAAARAGKRLLLANKEALVVAGSLLMRAVADTGAEILPIDSEHNAVFQCLPRDFSHGSGLDDLGVEWILLTASGGPFRGTPLEALAGVTPEEACAHPNWDMGRKISVDSATMMNKGLELIEACWLFDTRPERVRILVHPQSVIHSLVQYRDGSVLAQLGNPDMRTPIAHALAWPERIASGVGALDLLAVHRLDFRPADPERFPCLAFAYEAANQGGTCPIILNAANEVAVDAFLHRRIGFMDIPTVVGETLHRLPREGVEGWEVEQLLEADQRARRVAEQKLPQSVL
ncbi:MAG: 1-deoxy-D-xylulose-5-phosphate reductoisomerase [Candidatus Thiosymbion ectosymbiont of Robbea hypermnestra]|nr:1-deoxy-D-xylulose-5-phosphate reductoisomerase [Candidatus Thiosymbion ectosymbiont of Robbea hypermnestra]